MRPRPDAAENAVLAVEMLEQEYASMRPRPDAAENGRGRGRGVSNAKCFNEAAARCRGKPPRPGSRPRKRDPRFNEAAARCRGKL